MNKPESPVQPRKKIVLGLIGSPRKLGNCEVMVKEVSRNIEEDHILRLIRLPSLHILPCAACYKCVIGKTCPNMDHMEFLIRQFKEADAFIIASPIYFLGAHSIFKQVLDRGFLLYDALPETYGKPCILLNFYGMDDRIGAAPHTLMTLASFLGLDIKAQANIKAALPGEVLLRKTSVQQARNLGGRLFRGRKPAHGPGCPFCGCTIVRLGTKQIHCTLCHGTFGLDQSGKPFPIKEGGIFGTAEHMLLHKGWLGGMKDKFLAKRKEILRTTLPYKDIGEWVEP